MTVEFKVERKFEDATWVYHKIVADRVVDREQVMKYIQLKNYFGFHPAGYSGFLVPHDQKEGTEWTYKHYSSCD